MGCMVVVLVSGGETPVKVVRFEPPGRGTISTDETLTPMAVQRIGGISAAGVCWIMYPFGLQPLRLGSDQDFQENRKSMVSGGRLSETRYNCSRIRI